MQPLKGCWHENEGTQHSVLKEKSRYRVTAGNASSKGRRGFNSWPACSGSRANLSLKCWNAAHPNTERWEAQAAETWANLFQMRAHCKGKSVFNSCACPDALGWSNSALAFQTLPLWFAVNNLCLFSCSATINGRCFVLNLPHLQV